MQRGEKERDDALAWGETETTAAKKKKKCTEMKRKSENSVLFAVFPFFLGFTLTIAVVLESTFFFLNMSVVSFQGV